MRDVWISFLKKIFTIVGIISLFIIGESRAYAMEDVATKIQEDLDRSNAKSYEMNYILELLGITQWNQPPYEYIDRISDTYQADEPIGEYTEEALLQYCDKKYEIDINYYFGDYGQRGNCDPGLLVQTVSIYDGTEWICFGYNYWLGDAIMSGDRFHFDK